LREKFFFGTECIEIHSARVVATGKPLASPIVGAIVGSYPWGVKRIDRPREPSGGFELPATRGQRLDSGIATGAGDTPIPDRFAKPLIPWRRAARAAKPLQIVAPAISLRRFALHAR
jgi:hypothetical protein